jgi:hypothetical protein
MMFLVAVSSAAFVFALFILVSWSVTLDVRIALAGLYLLIGTVAHAGVAVLRRFDLLTDRLPRRGWWP